MQSVPPEFVVLSLALSGNPRAQVCTIGNVLGQTEAPLVVHFSFTSGVRIAAEAAKALIDSERGHLNPNRVRVGRLAPGILLAHLSNFDHALEVTHTNSETRFVWLSSNTILVRPGLEAWVLRHPISFCVHSTCADWPCTNEELLSGSCPSRIEQRLGWPVDETRSTPLSTRIHTLAANKDDALVRDDPWLSHFVTYLNTHENGLLDAGPVGLLTHEGSWYPRHLLQAFRQDLAGTPFQQTMHRYNKTGPRCPCCDLYGVNNSNSLYSTKGSCTFEELLLPTYVWQKYTDLIAHAAPSLAMRVWQRPQSSRLLIRAMDATAKAIFLSNAVPHVFAIKIPHRHSPDIVAMFNETLTTFAPHDECLHSHAGSVTRPAWH